MPETVVLLQRTPDIIDRKIVELEAGNVHLRIHVLATATLPKC